MSITRPARIVNRLGNDTGNFVPILQSPPPRSMLLPLSLGHYCSRQARVNSSARGRSGGLAQRKKKAVSLLSLPVAQHASQSVGISFSLSSQLCRRFCSSPGKYRYRYRHRYGHRHRPINGTRHQTEVTRAASLNQDPRFFSAPLLAHRR